MERDSSLYAAIYAHLLDEIKAGVYDGGVRLPTEKELTERFFVSRITAKRALNNLAEAGLVVRIPGRGTFLKGTDPMGHISEMKCLTFRLDDLYDEWGVEAMRGAFDESKINEIPVNAAIGDVASNAINYDGLIRMNRDDGIAVIAERKNIKNSEIKVSIDIAGAVRMIEEKLLEAGHRHVLYLYDRTKLFLPMRMDSGIKYTELERTACCECNTMDSIRARIKETLEENPDITCILAASHFALQATLLEKCIERDVRTLVVTCLSYPSSMGLSAVKLPLHKAGAEAVRMLKQMRKGNGEVRKELVLEPVYVDNGSI